MDKTEKIKKNMLLTFKSDILTDEDENNAIEFVTPAELTVKNNKYYITFEDLGDDTEAPAKSTLKIDADKVTLLRYGITSSQMIFEQGKKHTSNYQTPYGNISLGVFSDMLSIDINENGGNLNVSYGIYFEDMISHYTKLSIKLNEVRS